MNSMHRNLGVDLLRILSAFTVVLIHAPKPDLSYRNGLLHFLPDANAVFAFLAGWFMTWTLGDVSREDMKNNIRKRFGRLLLPYCFWSVVYILLGAIYDYLFTGTHYWPTGLRAWCGIVFGGEAAGQLWFVIRLFYVQIGVALLAYFLSQRIRFAVFALMVVTLFAVDGFCANAEFRMASLITSFVLYGIVMRKCVVLLALREQQRIASTCVFFVLIVVSCFVRLPVWTRVSIWVFGFMIVPLEKIGGGKDILVECANCTMGIYLFHHMIPERMIYKYIMPWLQESIGNGYLIVAIVSFVMFVVSLGFVLVLRRFSGLKFIFGE